MWFFLESVFLSAATFWISFLTGFRAFFRFWEAHRAGFGASPLGKSRPMLIPCLRSASGVKRQNNSHVPSRRSISICHALAKANIGVAVAANFRTSSSTA